MNLRGIEHIGIVVDRLERAEREVTEVLGLEQVAHLEKDDVRASFYACGSTRLELLQFGAETARLSAGETARIDHIAFEVDDIEQTFEELSSMGVEAQAPPVTIGAVSTFFTKPDSVLGIPLQFMQQLPTPE